MLSESLKVNTKAPHQELEATIIQKIKQLNSESAYVDFLKTFYGYIAAVEQKIQAALKNELVSEYNERRKAVNILNDIATFEPSSLKPIPLTTDLPDICSSETALGAMYVLEGSTLGGKYITRMISSKLNISDDTGFSFFNGYKEHTDMMWEKFKTILNAQAPDSFTEKSVVEAANQTFIKFKKWINEHQ